MRKLSTWGFFLIVIVLVIIIIPQRQYYNANHININGSYLIKPIAINDFSLIDQNKKLFKKNNLLNHWTFIFFGFTNCETICPTTLSHLTLMYNFIDIEKPQILFISIDPERDNPEKLKNFINFFNENFIAARAYSMEATKKLENNFHISSSTKNLNHSTEILLINPKAQIQAYFAYPPKAQQMAENYNSIVKLFNKNKEKNV